jgi:dTDP-4-amino-4,6-dideoxygalactose transaminase
MIPYLDLQAQYRAIKPDIDEAVLRVLDSAQFILGPEVAAFEQAFARYCGVDHAIGVNSGTSALHLALLALGIGKDDEVITVPFTFVATVSAIVYAGARPVFVDVEPQTLTMDPAQLERSITPRTRAIVPVHLYGQPADMDAIGRVASAAGIAVVEDAAQAHGATWNGRRAGGLSHVGCFSFYPGKNLGALGDAGAVVTDDSALAERVRSAGNHGRARNDPHRHEIRGRNERLDALQAACLSVKLERLDAWNAGRRRAARCYEAALAGLPVEPVRTAAGACSSHHLAVIQTAHRDVLRRRMAAEGISTGVHYPVPCHRQPAFAAEHTPPLPVVERAADRILSLPMYPHLTDADVRRVADAIDRALAEFEPGPVRLAS